MILIYLLFIILILVIIYLLLKSISSKKIIWQKISFLYNKTYKILILDFYKQNKNLKFKEEVLYFYYNIVFNNNVFVKNKKWQNINNFIKLYYKNSDNNNNIKVISDNINMYMFKYYKMISYNINILLFILAICITILLVIVINN